MNKRKLVLGFVFSPTFQKVLLIHKNRPDWQKGKLNGLGGKLNLNESKENGIKREVWEESSLTVTNWTYVGTLQNKNDIIYVFAAIYKGLQRAKTTTDEKVEWVNIHKLPNSVHPNLFWLVPFCIDFLQNKQLVKIDVEYGNT